MCRLDDLIARKSKESKAFAKAYEKENDRLGIAVVVMRLREENGLTQRELAGLAGKPQSTIARIESGTMNASMKVLAEIASSLGKKLEIRFV